MNLDQEIVETELRLFQLKMELYQRQVAGFVQMYQLRMRWYLAQCQAQTEKDALQHARQAVSHLHDAARYAETALEYVEPSLQRPLHQIDAARLPELDLTVPLRPADLDLSPPAAVTAETL